VSRADWLCLSLWLLSSLWQNTDLSPQHGGNCILSFYGYIDGGKVEGDTRWQLDYIAYLVGTIDRVLDHEFLPVHRPQDSHVV
jgi:hypothetical protein